jgi:hypothetical protein
MEGRAAIGGGDGDEVSRGDIWRGGSSASPGEEGRRRAGD